MDPFNIELLFLNNNNVRQLKEVKSLDIFEPNSDIFKLDGLFSQEIFGTIGSELRTKQYGYIDLKLKIMHPLAFRSLIQLKTLYKNIAAGKKYAIFDEDINDFVLSNPNDGETGYDFLIKQVPKLKLLENDSDSRRYKIDLIIKYYSNLDNLLNKWIVYPAGLRDYIVGSDNRGSYDEINDIYKKLLSAANMLNNTVIDSDNLDMFNTLRYKMQNITLEIYEHFENLLKGKKKFLQNKWTKRAITHGTRNVITATPIIIDDINEQNKISFNNTVVGIYQYIEAINPIAKYKILEMFSYKIFSTDTNTASLVNPKTLQTTLVDVNNSSKDDWLSEENLDVTISKMGQESYRSEPIMVEDNYLLLIYDDGKKIELIFNTAEIEDVGLNKKYIRPITYVELFYIAIYDILNKFPALVTRYPITEAGSIYPCKPYVRTTNVSRTVTMKYYGTEKKIYNYPILGESYFNSLSVHSTKLEHLGADMDGDTISFNVLYTDESIKEIDEILNDKKFYLTPGNELMYHIKTDPLELVLKHLTF